MATFHATVESEAEVKATRHDVWQVLTDPSAIAAMTPLINRIDERDGHWVWRMSRVSALGVNLTPVFTERMTLDPERRIEFVHEPPGGADERISVNGSYEIGDATEGIHLAISLTVEAKLPLPRAAGPAVTRVMRQTMMMMGERFAKNLLTRLDASVV